MIAEDLGFLTDTVIWTIVERQWLSGNEGTAVCF